jgi:hypothetical protein
MDQDPQQAQAREADSFEGWQRLDRNPLAVLTLLWPAAQATAREAAPVECRQMRQHQSLANQPQQVPQEEALRSSIRTQLTQGS